MKRIRTCATCQWFEVDRDCEDGLCHLEPEVVPKVHDDYCSRWSEDSSKICSAKGHPGQGYSPVQFCRLCMLPKGHGGPHHDGEVEWADTP